MPVKRETSRKPAKRKTARKSASPSSKVVAENKKLKNALRKVATILKRATKAKRKSTRKATAGF
jgi:hypothetical protein